MLPNKDGCMLLRDCNTCVFVFMVSAAVCGHGTCLPGKHGRPRCALELLVGVP